jgi:hypothetical protein
MSQYPSSFEESPKQPGLGLPITALVLAVLGLCPDGLALVALILGIVAIARGSKSGAGFGLSVTAIVLAAIALLVNVVSLGVFIPALGKAREAARHIKSSVQLRQIDLALTNYANDNKGWMPEAGADWRARLQNYSITPGTFVSPYADPNVTDSYIYIPGYRIDTLSNPSAVIIAYENPKYVPSGLGLLSVAYADGNVESIQSKDLQKKLDGSPKPDAASGGGTGGTPAKPKPNR